MAALTDLTLTQVRDGLRRHDFSATEMTEASIDSADSAGALNAIITPAPDRARAMAARSDKRLAAGDAGALEGVPIAVKDLFCTLGIRTTAASHILDSFVPTYESAVTANLWAVGAVMLGKTNLDEFAMGSSNENSYFGPVENPWRAGDGKPRVPGGSSGGSAALVAAGVVPGATGSDTGGSIRHPASFCGIVGMKPTYGRCSRRGMVAFASSLDQAGPMTRTVQDSAALLGAMAGFDPGDSTSIDMPVPDFEAALTGDVRGLRVGIPKECRIDGMPADIDALWERGAEWLRVAGAEVREVSLPTMPYALPTYYIVATAEASSNLARYDGVRFGLRVDAENLTGMYESTRAEGFGAEVRRRILMGTYVLSAGYYDAYYLKAQKVRTRIAEDFRRTFAEVDVLLTPTVPSAAFVRGEKSADPVAMYLSDVFCVPASLAGLPAISVPAGASSDALPLGLQIIGRAFDEETVFRAGAVLEEAAAFSARPAPWWIPA